MTLDQLKKRGLPLENKCGLDEENIEHLLIHCSMVWGPWTSLLAAKGVTWVPPFSIRDILAS